MRLTTVYRYQQIVRLYDGGIREPKIIAAKLHLSIYVVYRALREMFHVKQLSSDRRRITRRNSQNKAK